MPLSILYSRAQAGMESPLVTVETHLSFGMPAFIIVGLPETALRESRQRVRSALINSHFDFPQHRITVNLAPADLPKEGGRYDLSIALGILAASKQISSNFLSNYEFLGELALSGELRPIRRILPSALQTGLRGKTLILPADNAEEAALVKNLTILPAKHLSEVCALLTKQKIIHPYQRDERPKAINYSVDLSDIYGQTYARRALEIAAAGGHNLLLIGPPGSGKTMLATRLPTILPKMTEQEALEVATIRSLSHGKINFNTWRQRPFRSPHHSASAIALVGGGNPPRPGEVSLAHRGVLFLDELPEFNRHALETLREPMEAGKITISRAAIQREFPTNFQFIASMNPCPCGHLGKIEKNCRCTHEQINRYRSKISGPLLDRIDMHVEMDSLSIENFAKNNKSSCESSALVRERVSSAVRRQLDRSGKLNKQLKNTELEKYIALGSQEAKFLNDLLKKRNLSARSYHHILKVALTISDLAKSDTIKHAFLAEAFGLRVLDT
jgi:magnesium chelatase family protein